MGLINEDLNEDGTRNDVGTVHIGVASYVEYQGDINEMETGLQVVGWKTFEEAMELNLEGWSFLFLNALKAKGLL